MPSNPLTEPDGTADIAPSSGNLGFGLFFSFETTLSTRIKVVVENISIFHQFLPLINQGASLAVGV